jgi:DNA polymerase (family 10)
VPLAAARAVAAEVRRRLVFDLGGRPRRFEVIPVGSVRRRAPQVKDLDFLVVVPAGGEALFERVLAAARLPRGAVAIADTYAAGTRRRSFILRALGPGGRPRHYQADFFVTTAAERAFALYHYTGPRSFNIRTRALAKKRGWRLNQYGLFSAATLRRVPGSGVRTERALSALIGVTYRPPARRE